MTYDIETDDRPEEPPEKVKFSPNTDDDDIKQALADLAVEYGLDGGSIEGRTSNQHGIYVTVEWTGEADEIQEDETEDDEEDEAEEEDEADEEEDEEEESEDEEEEEVEEEDEITEVEREFGEYIVYLLDQGLTANQALCYVVVDTLGLDPESIAEAKGIQTSTVEKKVRQGGNALEGDE